MKPDDELLDFSEPFRKEAPLLFKPEKSSGVLRDRIWMGLTGKIGLDAGMQ